MQIVTISCPRHCWLGCRKMPLHHLPWLLNNEVFSWESSLTSHEHGNWKIVWIRVTTYLPSALVVHLLACGAVESLCIFWVSTIVFEQTKHLFNNPFPALPRWAGIRKVKPSWILLKQETVSGSCISWAICKSAPRSRLITMPAPHSSVFTGQMPFLPPNQQRHSTEGS